MDEDLRKHLGLFDETPLDRAIRGLNEATTETQRDFWLGQICSQLERNGNIEYSDKRGFEKYELLNNFIFPEEKPIILKKTSERDPIRGLSPDFPDSNKIYIKKPTETKFISRIKEFSPIEEYPVEKEPISLKTFPEPDPKRELSLIRDPFEEVKARYPSVSDVVIKDGLSLERIANSAKDAVEPIKVSLEDNYIPKKHEVTISCSCGYSHTAKGSFSGRE